MTTIDRADLDFDYIVNDTAEHFKVNGRAYEDQEIYEREMDLIFRRGWVYVGHASEIPLPGDYRLTDIAGESVIMCRDEEGNVQLLMNRCTHRANAVCQAERGNATYFRCSYHGWTFKNSGPLVGVTYSEAFPESFSREELGLARVPRVDQYRGFIFASLAEQGITLDEHLMEIGKEQIDRFCDLSPEGEIVARAGSHKYSYLGNWKFQAENVQDFYHGNFTHQAAVRMPRVLEARRSRRPNPNIMRYAGGGHGAVDKPYEVRYVKEGADITSSPYGAPTPSEEHDQEYFSQLEQAYGREKANEIWARGGPHCIIFPNLALLNQQIRVIRPVGPGKTEVFLYPVFLKGISDDVNEYRLRHHESFYGSAGSGSPDDVEMFARNQVGLSATRNPWLYLDRGHGREQPDPDGGFVSPIMDEIAQRGFWRHWKGIMKDEAGQV